MILFCREFFLVFTVVHKHHSKNTKVQLTPPKLFSSIEIYIFSQLLQRKIILIDKIPAFPQAFKVVVSAAIVGSALHSGIWVWL